MTMERDSASLHGEARRQTPGAVLQAERLRREMTVQQVAQDLHLDDWTIEALESDDYSALGAPVFAKGHLKQYAALLGLEPDELLIGYYQTREAPDEQPVISDVLVRRDETGPSIRWIVILLLVLVFALLGGAAAWLLSNDDSPLAVVSEEPARNEPAAAATEQPPAGETQPEQTGAVADAEPAESLPDEIAAVVSEMEVADVPVAMTPDVSLRMQFTQDSWVEVYDSLDNRILFNLARQDTEVSIHGVGPLRIFLGFADGVVLEVNGQPYEILPMNRRGNTARFLVDAADDSITETDVGHTRTADND